MTVTESRALNSRLQIQVRRSRWRRQRYYVRLVWRSNNLVAMHSETYYNRRDALNLVEALLGIDR